MEFYKGRKQCKFLHIKDDQIILLFCLQLPACSFAKIHTLFLNKNYSRLLVLFFIPCIIWLNQREREREISRTVSADFVSLAVTELFILVPVQGQVRGGISTKAAFPNHYTWWEITVLRIVPTMALLFKKLIFFTLQTKGKWLPPLTCRFPGS